MNSLPAHSAASRGSAHSMRRAKNAPMITFSIQNSASSANTLQSHSRTPATGIRLAASSTQAETGFSTDVALSANEADVSERKPVGDVAHQRAREVKLRAEAHFLQRGGLELGEQQLAHRLDRGVARLLAAADIGHLAEAFAAVHHVEQLPVLDHLGLALGEERSEERRVGKVCTDNTASYLLVK